MVSQKQLPKNWYPSSRSLVGVCLHFDCMRCIWRIFALFGTKVNPPFPLLLQDKPCWWNVFDCTGVVDQSSKLLQRLTGNQPSWQSYLSLWTELLAIKKKYLITHAAMPGPVQWKGPSSVSEASAAVVGQEAREGFISEWWMRLLKIVNEVLVILHKSHSFTIIVFFCKLYSFFFNWGHGDLAQSPLSF